MDMEVVQKCLQEAGISDTNNMDKKLMVQYYKAIKESESSSAAEVSKDPLDVEKENSQLNDSSEEFTLNLTDSENSLKEKPFTPKTWWIDKQKNDTKTPTEKEEENVLPRVSIREKYKLDKEMKDFRDSLEPGNVFGSTEFMSSSIEERVNMLYDYNKKYTTALAKMARCSLKPAPMPKLITVGYSNYDMFGEEIDIEETYVSRSGRQTKRKNYCIDDNFAEISITVKKAKGNDDNEEWLSKSKATAKTPSKISSTNVKSSDLNVETVKKSETKTPSRKKMSNEEVMKKSSLFAESTSKSLRKEVLAEKLKEENEKKKKHEQEMEQFQKTLTALDEDNETSPITVDDDSTFIRRRVVPPLPGRRPINRKKIPLEVEVVPSTSTQTNSAEDASKEKSKNPFLSIRKKKDNFNGTNDTAISMVLCPLCEKKFPQNEIDDHAWSCQSGVQEEENDISLSVVNEPQAKSGEKLLACALCDKQFEFDTNYQVHIKKCIEEKKKNLLK